jgi:hypothetical protein
LISSIADIIFILLITRAVKNPCEHVADIRYLETRIRVELVSMKKFGEDYIWRYIVPFFLERFVFQFLV